MEERETCLRVTDDKGATGDFLGGPAVKTLHFYCRGHWFAP